MEETQENLSDKFPGEMDETDGKERREILEQLEGLEAEIFTSLAGIEAEEDLTARSCDLSHDSALNLSHTTISKTDRTVSRPHPPTIAMATDRRPYPPTTALALSRPHPDPPAVALVTDRPVSPHPPAVTLATDQLISRPHPPMQASNPKQSFAAKK